MNAMFEALSQLHVLRPWWLLGLLALPLLAWGLRRAARQRQGWRQVVDAHLLPHLLDGEGDRQAMRPWGRWSALAALAFMVVLLPGWRCRCLAALVAVGLGAGLWQVAHKVNPRFHDRTMANFNNRDTVWGHSKLLADRKPVLGYGFGKRAFRKAFYENPTQRSPLVPVTYPHTHSYWLMLYFQGGAVGFALWSLGWAALGARLVRYSCREERLQTAWRGRLRARLLPVLLAAGLAFILVYGIGDFPDSVIRQVQFYLAGLALALTQPFRTDPGAAP